MNVEFLDVEDVLDLHRTQIAAFGGAHGVRDVAALESAVAQASASFGGEYLHHDPVEMAAAYMFHIVKNHPFVDGNKRAGLVAALVFLDLHGFEIVANAALVELTLSVADGRTRKEALAATLRRMVGGA